VYESIDRGVTPSGILAIAERTNECIYHIGCFTARNEALDRSLSHPPARITEAFDQMANRSLSGKRVYALNREAANFFVTISNVPVDALEISLVEF
jgi:hypothetical protein